MRSSFLPQPGRTDQGGIVLVVRPHNFCALPRHQAALRFDLGRDEGFKQVETFHDPAAQSDHLGYKMSDQIGEADPQITAFYSNRFKGFGVSLSGGGADFFRSPVRTRMRVLPAFAKGTAASQALPAATRPAETGFTLRAGVNYLMSVLATRPTRSCPVLSPSDIHPPRRPRHHYRRPQAD